MRHVRTVFLKCGGLHSNFVCSQISAIKSFKCFGFLMLNDRNDWLWLISRPSFSFKDFIWNKYSETNEISESVNVYLQDIHHDFFLNLEYTYPLRSPVLHQHPQLPLRTWDFQEKRIATFQLVS